MDMNWLGYQIPTVYGIAPSPTLSTPFPCPKELELSLVQHRQGTRSSPNQIQISRKPLERFTGSRTTVL